MTFTAGRLVGPVNHFYCNLFFREYSSSLFELFGIF